GDAIARHELDRVERRPVALDTGVVGARAAVHVLEREARRVARRMPAQIGDGRKAADQPGLVLQPVLERRRRQRRPLRSLGAVVHLVVSPALFFYQKWLQDGRANFSALPCASRNRAVPGPLAKRPISVSATPAARAALRIATSLRGGTLASTSKSSPPVRIASISAGSAASAVRAARDSGTRATSMIASTRAVRHIFARSPASPSEMSIAPLALRRSASASALRGCGTR